MAQLSFAQIEQVWIQGGGSALLAPVMAAIAEAESGGNTNAIGDYGTSFGLWQIHWTVHPQFNPSELFDPSYNAGAAIDLSGNGQSLSPWTTWESYIAGDGGHGDQVISGILGPYKGAGSIPSAIAGGVASAASAVSGAAKTVQISPQLLGIVAAGAAIAAIIGILL